MDTIQKIRDRARRQRRTIVLPEYHDSRVLEAAKIIEKEGLAQPLIMTPDRIDPQEKERYIHAYYEKHKARESDIDVVRKLFDDTLYYSAMMPAEGSILPIKGTCFIFYWIRDSDINGSCSFSIS